MSSGDGVAIEDTVGSSAEGAVSSGVEGVTNGVGTGVAEGAPQATSSRIITRLAANEAFTFMFMPPDPKSHQAYPDSVSDGYFTIPGKSSIIICSTPLFPAGCPSTSSWITVVKMSYK
jgi:hypothetical protein